MGINTLSDRTNGQTVDQTFFNELHTAIKEDFVGRNSSGVPTSGKNLGTSLYPWGKLYVSDIVLDGSLLDLAEVLASNPYKVVSGKTRTTSNQPAFLTPAGSGGGRSLTIDCTPTALVLEIAGTTVTISSDIVVSGLTAAPSSNNTCTINSALFSSQHNSRTAGESFALQQADEYPYPESWIIPVTSMGSEITALVGKRVAFKIVNGGNTEYCTAFVLSTTELTDFRRGFFYNSSLAPMNRIAIANSNVLTLMKMGWLFVDSDGTTADTTYNEPIYSQEEPTSPATGDYWYDLQNNLWKEYNGSIFSETDRILIGMFFCDASDCLGVRCIDFFAQYSSKNTLTIKRKGTTQARGENVGAVVNVAGNDHRFFLATPIWDITVNLAPTADLYTAGEQASRLYFMYVADTGQKWISDISPYFRGDLLGWYHPHNPWRCVGALENSGGSDFTDTNEIAHTGDNPWPIRAYQLDSNCIKATHVSDSILTARHHGDLGHQVSSSCGSFSVSSGSSTAVTNLSVSLTTYGRPVFVGLICADPNTDSLIQLTRTGAGTLNGRIKFLVGGLSFAQHIINSQSTEQITYPHSLFAIHRPVAGTYTYTVEAQDLGSGNTLNITEVKLIAFEFS